MTASAALGRRQDLPAVCQGQGHRQGADEGGGEEGEAELHGGEGGSSATSPQKTRKSLDGGGVLLVGDAGPAEGLDDLDALDVLHDGAVHVVGWTGRTSQSSRR